MNFRGAACFAILASAMLAAGCGHTGQPYMTEARQSKGLVVVLTGIHGRLWLSESICAGLDKGGVECAIEVYDWTYNGHWLPFYNLGAVERNHQTAGEVAQRVAEYRKTHPGKPVTLVGYSGGGPLAVWTAEAMAKEKQTPLDGVVLLSAPLRPEYDLSVALAESRKGIVSFYSGRDILYLAVGTVVFGTMDGYHCVSAGNVTFKPPADPAHPTGYERLFQVEWKPEMAKLGYDGSHLTIGATDFIAVYVAPLVKAKNWDATTLAKLEGQPAKAGT